MKFLNIIADNLDVLLEKSWNWLKENNQIVFGITWIFAMSFAGSKHDIIMIVSLSIIMITKIIE